MDIRKNGLGATHTNRTSVSQRALINQHALSKTERALIGADILAGRCSLEPTAKLIAAGVGCSVGYLMAARNLTEAEREAVEHGLRPLIQPKKPEPAAVPAQQMLPFSTTNGNAGNGHDGLTDEQVLEQVKTTGIARTWNAIERLIG
jgi:hypothetical protein